MAKSVLGNDPFLSGPAEKKPATGKSGKTKGAAKPKKASTPKAKPVTVEKPKPKTKPAKKTTAKASKVSKTVKAPSKSKAVSKAKPKTAAGPKAKPKASPKTSRKKTPKKTAPRQSGTGKSARVQPASVAQPESNVQPAEGAAEWASARSKRSLAIGGGDPKLIRRLRPDGFTVGQEYGYDPELSQRAESLLSFFYRFYWRVSVKGIENLPKTGRAVLVGNHAGILPFDSLMVSHAVRREAKRDIWPLMEDYYSYFPVLGPLLSRLGLVRACQENAQRLLAEDQQVLVFPEGIKGIVKPYRNRYRLERFGRGGFVKLCLVSDAPVIPVAIVGSEEVHPIMANLGGLAKTLGLPFFPLTPLFPLLGPLGLAPLPSKWTVIFGEPMYINQFGPEAAGDRTAVNRLSNQVKGQIQKMIDMEIGQRSSRWR